MVDKKTLTEEDIKRLFITKAITKAGWADDQIKMEYYFTDGRVIFEGKRMTVRLENVLIMSCLTGIITLLP